MPYLLGTDEAGYGPNLGPLVVAASAWKVPPRTSPDGLYRKLARFIAPPSDLGTQGDAEPSGQQSDERLRIADSKLLYKAGGSLELLERGVHTALALLDRLPQTWRGIWRRLDPTCQETIETLPWHAAYDEPLPIESSGCPSAGWCELAAGLKRVGVSAADLGATIVYPAAFNDLVDQYDTKAHVLSLTTLELVRRLLDQLSPDEPAIVVCDKHGGRGRYAALLQHVFPEELVQVCLETRELGIYKFQYAGRQVEFRFQVKGERVLPTALASMTAKYLRELAMRPFNAFWQRHVPGLKATAGYPGDARRFYDEIGEARRRLAIAERALWRER